MIKLSYSSMSLYDECPKKWELKYVHKMPEKPKHYFSFGKSIHSALEYMYSLDVCPPLEAVLDVYREKWQHTGYKDAKHEADCQRDGENMLRHFYAQLAPVWGKPLAVEASFDVNMNGTRVKGFIDRIDVLPDGTLHVLDYKTGKPLEPGREVDDEQLTTYQAAAEYMYPDSKVGKVSLMHVPSLAWHSAPARPPEEVERLRAKYGAVAAAIARKEFEPTPSEQACQWCDWKRHCPAWVA